MNGKYNRDIPASERLKKIAELVTPGFTFADVGTDHGYIPVLLTENGRNPYGAASDINKGPLEHAVETISAYNLEKRVRTFQSDGLLKYSPGEYESLILAGIGGELMIRILSMHIETTRSFREMILQPQSAVREVRLWLYESGFHIEQENIDRDDRKFYQMMRAVPGRERIPEEKALRYGPCLLRDRNKDLYAFIKLEELKKQKILSELSARNDRCVKRSEELASDISLIKEALDSYLDEG